MSIGYGWKDLEIGLMAMVPGIERTSHGNMLLAYLRRDRGAMIRNLQEQFGDDVDAVLDGVESIVDAELEVRASLTVHNGISGLPDRPMGMERGLRSAFFVDPPEENERDAGQEQDDILSPVGADLPPEADITDDAWFQEY